MHWHVPISQIEKLRPADTLPKDTLGSEGLKTQVQAAWLQRAVLSSTPQSYGPPQTTVGVGLILLVLEDRSISFSFCPSTYRSLAVLIPLALWAAIGS